MVSKASGALTDGAVAGTVQIRCAFTGPRDSAPPARCIGTAVGSAPERLILQGKGLPKAVINALPHSSEAEAELHLLCPVRALTMYMKRSAPFCSTQ